MPAIGPDLKVHSLRLVVAFALFGIAAVADTHEDVVDVFASMAAALSSNNAPDFLRACDPSMPDYDQLKTNVTALLQQSDVASSVEFLKDEGDDTCREVELDWFLELRNPDPAGPVLRRREVIHCRLEKRKKGWKVTSLTPVNFFAAEQF